MPNFIDTLGAGGNTLNGSNIDDFMLGNDGADTLNGGDGNDSLIGGTNGGALDTPALTLERRRWQRQFVRRSGQ